MKIRKCTTGVVVSFFFAAAMVSSLQSSPANAEKYSFIQTDASGEDYLSQAVLSGKKFKTPGQGSKRCKDCSWGE